MCSQLLEKFEQGKTAGRGKQDSSSKKAGGSSSKTSKNSSSSSSSRQQKEPGSKCSSSPQGEGVWGAFRQGDIRDAFQSRKVRGGAREVGGSQVSGEESGTMERRSRVEQCYEPSSTEGGRALDASKESKSDGYTDNFRTPMERMIGVEQCSEPSSAGKAAYLHQKDDPGGAESARGTPKKRVGGTPSSVEGSPSKRGMFSGRGLGSVGESGIGTISSGGGSPSKRSMPIVSVARPLFQPSWSATGAKIEDAAEVWAKDAKEKEGAQDAKEKEGAQAVPEWATWGSEEEVWEEVLPSCHAGGDAAVTPNGTASESEGRGSEEGRGGLCTGMSGTKGVCGEGGSETGGRAEDRDGPCTGMGGKRGGVVIVIDD